MARGRKGTPQRGYLDGQMLIAMPSMRDERFARTLIYICAHSPDGAMGIVVNQPSEITLDEIGRAHGIHMQRGTGTAYKGGPVQRDRGFLLHRRGDVADSVEVVNGIYLSMSTDSLKVLLEGPPGDYRLCLGYAG